MYERLSVKADDRGAAEHRAELLTGLTGRVVEVGSGNGLNFRHYPSTVTSVLAIEPEPTLRVASEQAARSAAVPVEVVDGDALQLPLPDQCVDAAVLSLVLCSVNDVAATLAEVRRVLRPGGELRFYEHVASEKKWLRRIQHGIAPYTAKYGGNCHPNRRTAKAIEAAGFTIERLRCFDFSPVWYGFPMAPHIVGIARS